MSDLTSKKYLIIKRQRLKYVQVLKKKDKEIPYFSFFQCPLGCPWLNIFVCACKVNRKTTKTFSKVSSVSHILKFFSHYSAGQFPSIIPTAKYINIQIYIDIYHCSVTPAFSKHPTHIVTRSQASFHSFQFPLLFGENDGLDQHMNILM